VVWLDQVIDNQESDFLKVFSKLAVIGQAAECQAGPFANPVDRNLRKRRAERHQTAGGVVRKANVWLKLIFVESAFIQATFEVFSLGF
jgi:uncharacterized YccA/Bax inhibitor family protein